MINTKALACAAIISAALLSPAVVFSQVYKCVDANGKTTFSDQGCATSDSATTVDIGRVNTQDSSQYQQRILDDRLERSQPKQKVRVTVVGDGRSDQRKRMQDAYCKAALTKHKGAHGLTAAQLSAASACAGVGSSQSNDNQRSSYSAPPVQYQATPPPSHITDCDGTGCWDNQGGRYNKAAGSTYFRQDGKACQSIGGQMQCN